VVTLRGLLFFFCFFFLFELSFSRVCCGMIPFSFVAVPPGTPCFFFIFLAPIFFGIVHGAWSRISDFPRDPLPDPPFFLFPFLFFLDLIFALPSPAGIRSREPVSAVKRCPFPPFLVVVFPVFSPFFFRSAPDNSTNPPKPFFSSFFIPPPPSLSDFS